MREYSQELLDQSGCHHDYSCSSTEEGQEVNVLKLTSNKTVPTGNHQVFVEQQLKQIELSVRVVLGPLREHLHRRGKKGKHH